MGRPSTPTEIRSLFLVLTAGCNLTCSYCFQNAKQHRRMSWRTLRDAIDLAMQSRQDAVELNFFGGEPLLEFPSIRRGVAYALDHWPPGKELRFGIITNGTLLRDEQLDFLVEHAFDVQLSFDGVAVAQVLRGRGTFEVLDRLLDRLRREQPRFLRHNVTVAVTVTSQTIDHIADTFRYLLDKGVRQIAFSPVFTHDAGWRAQRKADLEEQFRRVADRAARFHGVTGEIPLLLFRRGDGETTYPNGRTMCGVMRGETPTIDVDGQFYGCASFGESYQRFSSEFLRARLDSLRLGDFREEGFRGRYERFPDAVGRTRLFHAKQDKYSAYGRCAECRHFDRCSICPVSIGNIPGNEDPDRVPDFGCAFNLASLDGRERFLERLGAAGDRDFRDRSAQTGRVVSGLDSRRAASWPRTG